MIFFQVTLCFSFLARIIIHISSSTSRGFYRNFAFFLFFPSFLFLFYYRFVPSFLFFLPAVLVFLRIYLVFFVAFRDRFLRTLRLARSARHAIVGDFSWHLLFSPFILKALPSSRFCQLNIICLLTQASSLLSLILTPFASLFVPSYIPYTVFIVVENMPGGYKTQPPVRDTAL